ncbi:MULTISPECIES: tellurium resistance protein [unclassified Fusibacter]|uniref:vWA domain-containing protein n=1 Tax=unclassified Fusibacter TaxID=2624464 RepID=UPI0010130AFD|nr:MULTISPECIES: tellurium resistance protein [unclassified Fusibacter]MCK8061362.1 tellurium resistance protein [Fusibacter sp. A2]NPE23595.1 tellurium resistance protein [Fusibacter sp. A1]RXV59004.1 tellurium resistance protein [Fusibacter sp. A1]
MTVIRPGGELSTRPLHFIFVADCSTSMKNHGKMDALNLAIREAIPHMRRVAEENPNAEVLVRAVKFGSGAQWHIEEPTPVDEFEWKDLEPFGVTDMGKAFDLLSEALAIPPMSERALPPVLVLVSDGQPTDKYQESLDRLLSLPWGTKAVKLSVAIGKSASHRVLQAFINSDQIKVLQADRAEELVEYIKWASTAVLKAASSPASQMATDELVNVALPQIPDDFWEDLSINVEDVW